MKLRASLLVGALALVSCSPSRDFTGELELDLHINDPDARYEASLIFNPREDPELAGNLDNVESGSITKIELVLTNVFPSNEAFQVEGQLDVRPQGGSESSWIRGVGTFQPLSVYRAGVGGERGEPALSPAQTVTLELDSTQLGALGDLVFQAGAPVLELKVFGVGRDERGIEKGPVYLSFEIKVTVRGTGSA